MQALHTHTVNPPSASSPSNLSPTTNPLPAGHPITPHLLQPTPQALQPLTRNSVGIAPDIYEAWPYTMGQMVTWALSPAPEGMILELVEKGRKDARTWAAESGLTEAAAAQKLLKAAEAVVGGAGGGDTVGQAAVSGRDPAGVLQGQKEQL